MTVLHSSATSCYGARCCPAKSFAVRPFGTAASLIEPAAVISSDQVSISVAEFLELTGTLMQAPFVYRLDVETPVTANLEARDLALFEQAIDCRTMHPQVIGELAHGQNLGVCQHISLVPFGIS
jgi:hypothetical protein